MFVTICYLGRRYGELGYLLGFLPHCQQVSVACVQHIIIYSIMSYISIEQFTLRYYLPLLHAPLWIFWYGSWYGATTNALVQPTHRPSPPLSATGHYSWMMSTIVRAMDSRLSTATWRPMEDPLPSTPPTAPQSVRASGTRSTWLPHR